MRNAQGAIVAEHLFSVQSSDSVVKDPVTGQPLDVVLVKAARELEAEALVKTGKAPITVRWIDTNKGDDETRNRPNSWRPPVDA